MGCTGNCPDALRGVCGTPLPNPEQRRINVDPWYKPPVSDPLFVIMWWYSDKSDFGLIDIAFRTREQAVKICELLQEHSGTKQFLVNQLEIQR